MKAAVIYYSRSGVTKKIADKIHGKFNADMFRLEPKEKYGNYISAVLRNGGEKLFKEKVAVNNEVKSYDEYDVIFIGFPVWYSSVPGFMQEYLKECGITGKTIIPFATAGVNGKESSLKTVRTLFPECKVEHYYYTTSPKQEDIDNWIDEVNKDIE